MFFFVFPFLINTDDVDVDDVDVDEYVYDRYIKRCEVNFFSFVLWWRWTSDYLPINV